MKEEPFFLVNEFLEKEKKEIEQVLDIINVKNFRRNERAVFLRNITNELFKSYRKTKKIRVKEQELDKIRKKELLLKKKSELMKKLKDIENKKPELNVETKTEKKNVILSKETGKALVNTQFNGTLYLVKEPELNLQDHYLLNEFERMSKAINIDDKQKLLETIKILCDKYKIVYTDEYFDKIRYYIIRDLKKYGKISALVEDKDIKEVICSGFNKPITVTYNDKQDIPTNIQFSTEDELNEFILKIAKRLNQQVSVENPFLNMTLDKINIQATCGSEFVKPKFLISKL